MGRLHKPELLYTVYNNKTDMPVAVAEPAQRAAYLTGLTLGSFYCAVSRQYHKGYHKWHIERESALIGRGKDEN